jgi:hypothetical protein
MRVLLLSFSTLEEYRTELQRIREVYRPESSIFVLENTENASEVYVTFNTTYNFKMSGIIKMNKNKDTNTLFTIDALNTLAIREIGKISRDFVPDWELYRNSLLLIRDGELYIAKTKIKEIIKIERH